MFLVLFFFNLLKWWLQGVDQPFREHGPQTSKSLLTKNMLKMNILGLHLRPTKFESWGGGASSFLRFNMSSGDSDTHI